ncbi:MAG: redoxin domain-containing protein [Thermoleophilaceae bacterium]
MTTILRRNGGMPSLAGASEWLNSEPLTPADLHGRAVLIDFGTYTCINWLRTLPHIRAWADKYREHGLVVVGIQTPEFEFEQNLDSVRREVKARRIDWPIAVDNHYEIWRAFSNNYWPALYFVDREGVIRHHHFGEGRYEQSERVIQRLLGLAPHDLVTVDGEGDEAAADWSRLNSPETYLGYERTGDFASQGGVGVGEPRVYAPSRPFEAQPVGALRRLDDGARARQAERGRRADLLPLRGTRRPPRAATNGAG